MIDFIPGTIHIGDRIISIGADCETLNDLVQNGLIDKRRSGRGTDYYYLESFADNVRFGIFITPIAEQIEWIRLSWLDSAMENWDEISERL